jgi:DNA-binding MarR family transcriptional regulator
MVNKLVQLVNLWADFEAQNPEGDIKDFCMDFILKDYLEKKPGLITVNGQLASLTGKLSRYAGFYSKKALEKFSLNNMEDWVYLMRLHEMGTPKKSELIYDMISEFPSGIDVIKRLVKSGLVQEFPDAEDKRSKRIQITTAGIEILGKSLPWMEKISDMAFNQLLESEKVLLIELLNRLNDFHKTHYLNVRNASLEMAYKTLVSQS